ncbi:Asp-tRNA(Asn)/Glu-tRNA(Gln) amidotransferase GatCAB subunit C [Verminephrobacter aporrectodeae subsp. tuberculatae]|uniref:molybdopterin guanine dinucleotide-containing S/N-oxide reductase n=1 Tax=Verminephrobacter aporrectodeae TaxID=1110389 RepID=UPI002236FEF7|nr:molybdopterin guanine dinucleotide-containing S/N-oxide reductase [Verminephrobacter aporrectodeae]MCW5256694.1 Asp-tRNA(Asn)/Glu-tRNA(Gln) amidotransferase GatCAB subunit C [Verminephrobacter aporrectodeae subsp. tuberculatae]
MSTDVQRFPSLSHWGAFTAVVRAGRLLACEPFAFDSAPSPILQAMPGMVHSSLRICRPAVRKGWLQQRQASDRSARGSEAFVEVPWDTALELVAEELARVRGEYGNTALFGGSYGWSSAGRLHHARTLTHRFLNAGGGCVHQAGNYSWGAAQFLLPHVIGTHAPVTGRVTDWNNVVAHTGLFIAFGGLPLRNTQITSGGAGEHSAADWLARAAAVGVEFVVVSPTRSDVPAGTGARWIPIRPNTDTALMLAMVHTLIVGGLHARDFLQTHCVGFGPFSAYLLGETDGVAKDAQWAQGICGVPAAEIRALALRAAGKRTLLSCAWSLQRAHHGEQPYWASIALAAALGQIGLPGGGFAFGHGSMNGVGNPRPDVPGPEMSAGRNPTGRAIPVARLADMLLHPGEPFEFNGRTEVYPDIRMVYWAGGNPFHHHQDLNRLVQAWQKPQTIVVHESWWTPTARRADIVLPATTTLERNDIGGSSRDRFVLAMHQALAPHAQSRNDFDIYRELSAIAGHELAFTEGRDEGQWLRHIYASMRQSWRKAGIDAPGFDAFWDAGHWELPRPDRDFVLFEAFRRDPRVFALKTPSGKIEICSQRIAGFGYADCPPHPTWMAPVEWLGAEAAQRFPLHLVSSQPADKLHSQMDAGTVSRAAKIKGRERVLIAPADAARRAIASGDLVKVFNRRGACIAAAVVDPDTMQGVAIMSTGAWFDPAGPALERHGNPNVLTIDIGTSRLAQAPSALSALVEIEKWQGAAPAVRAFEVPEISGAPPSPPTRPA